MAEGYRAGVFPGRAPTPRPVRRAARVMYLTGGLTVAATLVEAVLTAVFNVLDRPAFTASDIPKSALPPGATAASFHPAGTLIGVVIPTIGLVLTMTAVGLGVSAPWFLMGAKCKAGRGWARTVSTVLFSVYTFGLLIVIGLTGLASHAWPLVCYLLIPWLLGLAAIVLLWQRQSSAFFRATS